MKRIYTLLLEEHLKNPRQMAFISGPRQVEKNTTSHEASEKNILMNEELRAIRVPLEDVT